MPGWGQLHRWLGLTLSLWLVLVSLTGTLLFYKTELLQLKYPQLKLTAIPDHQDAARVFDRFDAGHAFLPRADKPWIEVVDASGTHQYFNAAGEHLLSREHMGDWISWFVEFHHHLLLDELGKDIQGYLGLASLLLVVAGLAKWWPQTWSHRLFTIRWAWPWQKNFRATLWQLHRVTGVVLLIPLLILLITGTAIMYSAVVSDSLTRLFPEQQQVTSMPAVATEATSWPQRLRTAEVLFPEMEPRLVYLDRARIRFKYEDEWHPNGRSYMQFDPLTGALVSWQDIRNQPYGTQLAQMVYPLHVSAIGGVSLLTLLVAGGIALMVLPVSGVWFWVWRQRRKKVA